MKIATLVTFAVALGLVMLAPAASAKPPQSYPACVAGVTAAECYGGHDVCSPYGSLQVPACVDVPCYHPDNCFQ